MKKIVFFICLIFLTLPSCSTAQQNESLAAMNQENLDSDTETEPSWAKETQTEGRLFQGLNLDGAGDLDDEIYVSVYQFGDSKDEVIVLRAHLGTGETLAKVLPVSGWYSLHTGKLFSTDRDAIVVEVVDPVSNWGSANIFALGIYPIDPTRIDSNLYIDTLLDTSKSPVKTVLTGVPEGFRAITDGTRIVDIDGSPLQGLEIYFTGPERQWREGHETFLWSEGEWKAVK